MITTPSSTASDPAELARLDRAHILHPQSVVGHPEEPLIVARGEGALVWDVTGKQYVDGTCGLWLNAVGHGRRDLADVAAAQIQQLEYYSSFGNISNPPAIKLAEKLATLAPAGLNTVFYTSGGSEGIESAVKLARLAHYNEGQPERTTILSRNRAYHGSGSVSMAACGFDRLKEGFGPMPPGILHLSAPQARTRSEVDALVEEVDRTIQELGPKTVAAFVAEPVMGYGGVLPPPDGYWAGVQEVLRRHGVLLILDEVVTAYGRTGHWFAAERYGIEPDMIVTAKALTSGYMPMGAILLHDRLMGLLDGAAFRHGFTYNGHPVAAAVALANLEIIEREGLLDRARETGAWMLEKLKGLEELPVVEEVRGVGMMFGIELNVDTVPVMNGARRDGVIVRGIPPCLILAPPLVLDRNQAATIVDVLWSQIRALC